MYMLGCLPFLQMPIIGHHLIGSNRRCFSVGTHSCIYTKPLRDRISRTQKENILDWDMYNQSTTKYMYYTLYVTSDLQIRKFRSIGVKIMESIWLQCFILLIFIWLGMYTIDPSFGFRFIYWFSYLFTLIIFVCIFLIGRIAYYLIQKKRIKIKR